MITPNLAVKPATVMITEVKLKGMKQAVQMFGPAQAAVAKAVAITDLVSVCGVFIYPAAADDKKIYEYNYHATDFGTSHSIAGKSIR